MSETKKLIERTVTVTCTLAEAARALGKVEWAKESEYLDADSHSDVWHSGYSARDVRDTDCPAPYDGAEKLFPNSVAIAREDAERDAYAEALTKERHNWIEEAFSKISVVGEYMTADQEMIDGLENSPQVVSCDVDAPNTKVTLVLQNPEHLINDLVAGVGYFHPDIDPYEAMDDNEIVGCFLAVAKSFFDVYGERWPSDDFRVDSYPEDDVLKDHLECRLREDLAHDEDAIAEALMEAIDSEDMEPEEIAKEAARILDLPLAKVAEIMVKKLAAASMARAEIMKKLEKLTA